jgi:hypothetical protein
MIEVHDFFLKDMAHIGFKICNDPAAFIRPGRVDKMFRFGNATSLMMQKVFMTLSFFEDFKVTEENTKIICR